jgi:DNA polymerase/3'-5' exonuclease PolX
MSDQETKTYPLQDAVPIAEKFIEFLTPYCLPNRIMVVGSIRRRKPFVKDIELLMVSKPGTKTDDGDLFKPQMDCDAVEIALEKLITLKVITKRENKLGRTAWGKENKLGTHCKSGMPIDFFITSERNWFMSVVIRTGPAKLNKEIGAAAIGKGWKMHAYGDGFTRNDGKSSIDRHQVTSERDVFEFVGMPYREPTKR